MKNKADSLSLVHLFFLFKVVTVHNSLEYSKCIYDLTVKIFHSAILSRKNICANRSKKLNFSFYVGASFCRNILTQLHFHHEMNTTLRPVYSSVVCHLQNTKFDATPNEQVHFKNYSIRDFFTYFSKNDMRSKQSS